jgi:hypothetical protein
VNFRSHRPSSPRFISLLLTSIFGCAAAFGSGRDSVITVAVEPGVTHLTVFRDGPSVINVLVVDLAAKHLRLESYRTVGLVPTSQQATKNDWEGHRVVAAINADFFSFKTGWPIDNQVANGVFVLGTQTERSHLAIDNRGKPYIEKISFHGWIKPKSGGPHTIAGINDLHRNNAIILYNSYSDTATNVTDSGTTFLFKLVNSTWSIGDTLKMVVMRSGETDLSHIPADQAVLWVGGGSDVSGAKEDMKNGDTALVYLGLEPAIRNIQTILGGCGTIISRGVAVDDTINVREKTNVTFLRSRHPRTFVGFDRDTTKLFLCTVDGRQQISVGMSFHEMADFLSSIGVWNAVNLDGGGSTTMVLNGKIINSPSDRTGERPVANSLQVIRVGPPSFPK